MGYPSWDAARDIGAVEMMSGRVLSQPWEPRQHGGPVWSGGEFLVGEVGPERLRIGPGGQGYVTPLGGREERGGGIMIENINLTFHVDATRGSREFAREIAREVRSEIARLDDRMISAGDVRRG